MSETTYEGAVATARDYYNSDDADNFYFAIWGGEDIHVGTYLTDDEDIATASQRTVENMCARVEDLLVPGAKVLDIGAGYGGAARHLAERYGCHVVALNLSEVENARNREISEARGLSDKVDVVDGSFEDIPYDDAHFDVVWSQDAILHSGNRRQVLAEVYRVLKPGGAFVFTDPMQADNCPDGVLNPILERIHLESLGAPGWYQETARALGFTQTAFEDQTHQLIRHYGRVYEETENQADKLKGVVSEDYITRMKKGLRHWTDGGEKGYLSWGVFLFRK